MNDGRYIRLVRKFSLTLGKMIVAAGIIFAAIITFLGGANSIAAKEASIPREVCPVASFTLSDISVSADDLKVVVEANCSFGQIKEESHKKKALLMFALNPPTKISCYEEIYPHITIRGCDMPS